MLTLNRSGLYQDMSDSGFDDVGSQIWIKASLAGSAAPPLTLMINELDFCSRYRRE